MKNRYKYKLMDYFIMDEKSLAQRKKFVKDCEKFFKKERERASERASREGGPVGHELVSEQAYERFASKQALMCPQSSTASGGTSRMSASKPRTDEL